MERLLARLERRIGKLAIPRLGLVLAGGMAIVTILLLTRPEVVQRLTLDVDKVAEGEVWRLVTYAFVPTAGGMGTLGTIMQVLFLYWVASAIEREWGAFKLNVYVLLGWIFTTGGAVLVDRLLYRGAAQLAMSDLQDLTLLLAFATLAPEVTILVFFVLPLRMVWVALLALAFMVYRCVQIGEPAWFIFGAGILNYLLFFAGHIAALARGKTVEAKQAARRASSRPPPAAIVALGLGHRTCAICGAKEEDGADIRVCTCEKCGGKPRNLCLAHARNH